MLCGVCNGRNTDTATACRSCGSPLGVSGGNATSTAGLQGGTKLDGGKFTVGKVLGQGGFGITYLGGDISLGRAVAIKEFFPHGCTRQGATVRPGGTITVADYHAARQKFLEEARMLAQFQHRGIVAAYSTFEENNTAYMVMEFVKGATLLSLVESRGPLPEKEAVGYITQAADALNAVHEAKLLHRDIKPENLMVTQDGRVILVDFGTARAFAPGNTRRMTAMLTPGYAPLEQYGQQARFGVFTDLYALGATCYHLLTGQMPVQATDRAAGVELQPPHQLNHKVGRAVSGAVMWAMEMRADRRPQSARDFTKALNGGLVQASLAGVTQGDTSFANGRSGGSPYDVKLIAMAAELKKPPAAVPPSIHEASIAAAKRQIALSAGYRKQESNRCPGCGNASLEEVAGRFKGKCPVCRSGDLVKRKLDFDKCPICRNGQLGRRKLEPPLIFCPICRMKPLREEYRKRLGMRIDLWWVCPHCNAEFDVADLQKEWVKLERYGQDSLGVAAKYVGQKLPTDFWLQLSPQCNLARECANCDAAFYEFSDDSMMLWRYSGDPYGVGKQTQENRMHRVAWAKLAHNLPSHTGNSCCRQCRSEFNFDQARATLALLACDAVQYAWASELKGQSLPVSTWCLGSEGKRSLQPGWLCKQCATEFDVGETIQYSPGVVAHAAGSCSRCGTNLVEGGHCQACGHSECPTAEVSGLKLVRSNNPTIAKHLGAVNSLADWQRLGSGVPTVAEERRLHEELKGLQSLKQQEDDDFRQRQQEHRDGLEREFNAALREAILGGFTPIGGNAKFRLNAMSAINVSAMKDPIGRLSFGGGDSLTLECQITAGRTVAAVMYLLNGRGRTKGVLLFLAAQSFYHLRDCIHKADDIFRDPTRYGQNQIVASGSRRGGVRIPVGNVTATLGGTLSMECEVFDANTVCFTMFAWDGDGRTRGVFMSLSSSLFRELKELVHKVDEVFCLQALEIDE